MIFHGVVVWMVFYTKSCTLFGNRYVPVLNRNDSKRNLNLNNWANDWNGYYRFLGVRN